MKRPVALVWSMALASLMAPGCLYDPDDRCGPHQVPFEDDRCACEPGFVPGASGCVPCGELEMERSGECVCVDGYARLADDAACEPVPAELGAECDTESEPCPAGRYAVCHASDGSAGYCTSACTSSDDCDGGYRCHQDGADSYCRRPPVGYGESCETDDDCSDGEATYCEVFQENICLVPCSAGNTDVCFEGEVCCDFVLFNPICVPADACAPTGTEVE